MKPQHKSNVNIAANTKMRMGEAAGVEKLGTSGGGTQFQLLNEIPENSFTNSRALQ